MASFSSNTQSASQTQPFPILHLHILTLVPQASAAPAAHLNLPPSASAGVLHSRSIAGVQVHPAALFGILDHYLRRNDAPPSVDEVDSGSALAAPPPSNVRVIGTLLGTRTASEIEIRSAFAVPHIETADLIQIDMEYHRDMYELHHRANPQETLVGWYVTGTDIKFDAYSALIQDFYSRECAPHQAVHLTMDTNISDSNLGVRAYVGCPLGLNPKASNAIFVPLPLTLLSSPSERPALSLLSTSATDAVPLSDMDALAQSLRSVQGSLERVLAYVRDVISGKRSGDAAVGRFVMDAVGSVQAGELGAESHGLESAFNAHLQDVLMISYLANVVRAQAEVSLRLQLLT